MSVSPDDPGARTLSAEPSTAMPPDATVVATPVLVVESPRPTLAERIRARPAAAFGAAVAIGWTAAKVLRGVMRARRRRRG